MTAEAIMAELGSLWMDYVGADHHKDRDCHFIVEQYFSYGSPPYWTANHSGYVDDGFGVSDQRTGRGERRFPTHEAALAYCIDETLAMFRRHYAALSQGTVDRLKILAASAIEAGTGETGTGSTAEGGESAVPKADAQ